jgi:uncharacterized protein (TIGR03089 family)
VTPARLLRDRAGRDPGSPLLTWYDDAAGARVELSGATMANAVAKAAGLLADEFGVAPGDEVGIALPLHWQAAVILLACWATGCEPKPGSAAGAVAFVTSDGAAAATAAELVVVSLAPLGGRVPAGVPSGTTDFADAAAYPDVFSPSEPTEVDPGPPLPERARVLSVLPYDRPQGRWWGLLGPLSVGGSVALVANADVGLLAGHAVAEQVTHTAGVSVAGLPRLDG